MQCPHQHSWLFLLPSYFLFFAIRETKISLLGALETIQKLPSCPREEVNTFMTPVFSYFSSLAQLGCPLSLLAKKGLGIVWLAQDAVAKELFTCTYYLAS